MSYKNKKIPLYVVMGFLSTGKTTCLKAMTDSRSASRILIGQCEQGHATIDEKHVLSLPIPTDDSLHTIATQLTEYIAHNYIQEVWIEWNGMADFSLLERLCALKAMKAAFSLSQVYYVTTTSYCEHMLGLTGNAPTSQLEQADVLIVMTAEKVPVLLQKMAHNRPIYTWHDIENLPPRQSTYKENEKPIFKVRKSHLSRPLLLALLLAISYIGALLYMPNASIANIYKMLLIWTSILLQALPFLAAGAIVSGFLQILIPPRYLEKLLSGNPIKGYLVAMLSGAIFPVCDCGTIPIFKSLVAKGVPVPVAMMFMLSSPITNPIAILATYYAFNGQPEIVVWRLVLGILGAIIISATFSRYRGLTPDNLAQSMRKSYATTWDFDNKQPSRWQQLILHSRKEFYNMAPFMIVGSLVASLFQVFGTYAVITKTIQNNIPLSIICMMVAACLLSLCSTSDAMVAKSFSTHLPLNAIMGFLLLGPMMDVKNILILSSSFPKSFIIRLFITTCIVCFFASLFFAYYGATAIY